MPDVDLIFGANGPHVPQSPTDLTLRLGPPPGGVENPYSITVAAVVRPIAALLATTVATALISATIHPTAAIAATSPAQATISATAWPTAAVLAGYDIGIPQYVANESHSPWSPADELRNAHGAPWRQGAVLYADTGRIPWRQGAVLYADTGRIPWRQGAVLFTDAGRVSWRDGAVLFTDAGRVSWRDGAQLRPAPTAAPWRDAARIRIDRTLPWRDGLRLHTDRVLAWREAQGLRPEVMLPWRGARFIDRPHALPWQHGLFVESHGGWPFPPPPAPPVFVPPVDLEFCQPWTYKNPLALPLVLGVDPCGNSSGATTWIPFRKVYMQVHTIDAVRLPDMLPLDIFSADIATDDGSFGWQLGATGPLALLTQLAPVAGVPAQIRITLDGLPFVFAVEGLRRNRAFGQTGVSISGRSITALVGEPYLPQSSLLNGIDRLAQQLAVDALQFTGVALDWGITDWLVPAGAWSFTGSPLAAVQRVAEAAGAIVQSHRSAATLRVLPRYPALPWDWATTIPDVQMPSAVVVSEGWERSDRPGYNGIYVSGQSQGVLGFVKRTGTAGDVQAAMITDALVTHADAARQRGSAILGAAGAQARVTIEMPVLTGVAEPGVIDVGKLVQVNDGLDVWRGLVRSVSVRATRPSLRQTLVLERHL